MKKVAFMMLCLSAALFAEAYPNAILPRDVKRRGLTNTQIQEIYEKRPEAKLWMSQQDWMALRFQLCRYENITNWVDEVADKAGFADRLATAEESVTALTASTNRLSKAVDEWRESSAEWEAEAGKLQVSVTNLEASVAAKVAELEAVNTKLTEYREGTASVREQLTEKQAYYQELADKATLKTTKAMLQAVADLFGEMAGKLPVGSEAQE